jgi:nitrous-oxide reductase
MKRRNKAVWLAGTLVSGAALVALWYGCAPKKGAGGPSGTTAASGSVSDLMKARNLSETDVLAALKTYTPTGKRDDYMIFASGGHGGNVIVIGVPSMRILKYIPVFNPEPWSGYGYGDQSTKVLEGGFRRGKTILWGDTHHPALSETNGDYDGQYLFINDKAAARVAVINLKDFNTTQIVSSNLIESDHGGTFVTPNTEYVVETSQYAAPLGGRYAPIEQYKDVYRGAVILWKFDRVKGRIIPEESWAIEVPPYFQDLADAGKKASDGWLFINSINTELAYGGTMEGRPPLESSASKNDMDYLHVVHWKKAEELVRAGKTTTIAGMKVLPLKVAADEGVLYFIGEPKSPHGVDISPDGESIVVGGKLDTHATVYSMANIKRLTEQKKFDGRDPYGVPILPFKESIRGQCKLGLGPLHHQYDAQGNVYTSMFLESAVAKWSLKDLKVIEKVKTHYNIGHLVAAHGDTVSPHGKYLVAMNKWALDRFNKVGPLLPQNFQLVDIGGQKMQVLYDMPIPLGEPHYAQMIKADLVKTIDVYTPIGTDPYTHKKAQHAVEPKKERIERKGDGVHVYMSAIRSHFTPDIVRVKEGDRVHLHVTSMEQAYDATHGLALGGYNINSSIEPGKHVDISFVADKAGVFPFYCSEFCSALHLEMMGYLLVEPK